MNTVELLLDTAREDTNLLIKNDQLGDDFLICRNVDFLLYTSSEEQAKTVTDFINDNRYAEASMQEVEGAYRILAVVNMPVTQNILCSISGLFTCLSKIFKVEYDGWGTKIKR